MDSSLSSLAALAAEASIVRPDTASALVAAANLLLPDLERGRAVDAQALRAAMVAAFGGSDAEGAWTWKTAYEACEAAQVLFLRKFGPAMRKRGAAACLPTLAKIAALVTARTPPSREPPRIIDQPQTSKSKSRPSPVISSNCMNAPCRRPTRRRMVVLLPPAGNDR
jgi:hypothetical protein